MSAPRQPLSAVLITRNAAGQPLHLIVLCQDITERKKAEETRCLLIDELNHRVKNTLATIQAIAQQTLRRASSAEQFVTNFGGRIQALSRVHTLLSRETWQGADLHELIRDQVMLGPIDETRLTAWGPAVTLGPQLVLHLAMVLHELGTNSCKYGALSVPEGWVTVNWTVEDQNLRLQWVERGGPPVKAPASPGFGSLMIEQSVKAHLGSAHMLCEGHGVTWSIALPLPRQATAKTGSQPAVDTAANPATPTASGSAPRARLASKRVLVVEDEPLVALDLLATLQDAGAQPVGPAGTTADALRLIEATALDAALIDGNLNGSPVDEIASALTQRRVPFAFVTGYGRDSLPRAFRGAAILSKPYPAAALVAAVEKLLDRPALDGNTVPFRGRLA